MDRPINPDDLLDDVEDEELRRDVTFIYGPNENGQNELIVGKPEHIHYDVLKRLNQYKHVDDQWSFRKQIEEYMLLGRVGMYEETQYVSFWNEQPVLDKLLIPCLMELLDNGYIDENTLVATKHDHEYVANVLKSTNKSAVDTPKQAKPSMYSDEEWELYKNMHIMRGNQKKDAMRKLGLGTGGHKHEWQKALEKADVIGPGQKWWAPQSENINRLSDLIE